MSVVIIQNAKDAAWISATGDSVPAKHITRAERLKESRAGSLYKKAVKAAAALAELYADMQAATAAINAEVQREYELKHNRKPAAGKGGFTWYNFDGSLKFQVVNNDFVKWDDQLMAEAKQLLDDYLSSQLTDNQSLILGLVNEAFANTKGAIDGRKVFALLKHEAKIPSSRFKKACELMRQAQRIDKSKLYMTIAERQEDGSYQNITLNFSNL